jgi:hypothetical protein
MACGKLTRHAWLGAALLHWATRCAHAALGWSLRAWQLELIEQAEDDLREILKEVG